MNAITFIITNVLPYNELYVLYDGHIYRCVHLCELNTMFCTRLFQYLPPQKRNNHSIYLNSFRFLVKQIENIENQNSIAEIGLLLVRFPLYCIIPSPRPGDVPLSSMEQTSSCDHCYRPTHHNPTAVYPFTPVHQYIRSVKN